MKNALLIIGGLVLSLLMVLPASPASAHTPSGGATCALGVYASATGYEASDTNAIAVVMDKQSKSQYFDTDASLSIPIPADGKPHKFSWFVHTSNRNPAYSTSGYGTITCPGDTVSYAHVRTVSYCNAVRIEGRRHVESVRKVNHADGRVTFYVKARYGYVFRSTGTQAVILHRHVKRTGCGSLSGS